MGDAVKKGLWTLAGASLATSLLLPWWNVSCDDGCSTGETGLVEAHVLGSTRGVATAVLLAAALLVVAWRPVIAVTLVGIAAVLVGSMIVVHPTYSTAAPYYFGHLAGWYLALAGMAAWVAAIAATARAPRVVPPRPARSLPR